MISVYLLGSSGFLGQNFINDFNSKFKIINGKRNFDNFSDEDVIINFAGKAHDNINNKKSNEYYKINTEFCKKSFDLFLNSKSSIYILISSIKAVADNATEILNEEILPNPQTHYGKSKLMAEEYISSHYIPIGKRVYILRPCMIHGPNNKANINLLYKIASLGLPWPLGNYNNKRSFCSIYNLFFVINELIINTNIDSGIYNVADDDPITINDLIKIIAITNGKKPWIIHLPKLIINFAATIGDFFYMPLNTERLNKLTENYIVCNKKIINAIKKPLPYSCVDGLKKTFKYLKQNAR